MVLNDITEVAILDGVEEISAEHCDTLIIKVQEKDEELAKEIVAYLTERVIYLLLSYIYIHTYILLYIHYRGN